MPAHGAKRIREELGFAPQGYRFVTVPELVAAR